MAVFYVLPPRVALGEALARFLRPYFPGLAIGPDTAVELLETLTERQPAYFVHREELPGDDVIAALRDGWGAETGDQVVHVSLGARGEEPLVRIGRVPATSPAPAAAALL